MLLDVERFVVEAYFHFEKRSPPSGVCSRKRSVAEAHYCALLECYAAPCLVE
jgi:hypothetical protein